MPDPFRILAATGRAVGDNPSGSLYALLIGSWEVEARWYEPGGLVREATGEWHFAWIMGGLGVQDVLFKTGALAEDYGTTIRCYDETIDAWRASWMAPGGKEFVSLIGRPLGDDIVQEGAALDGSSLQKWTFSKITADGFHWRGQSSNDGGTSWQLDQEMRCRRMAT
jgi:hypothetical protein